MTNTTIKQELNDVFTSLEDSLNNSDEYKELEKLYNTYPMVMPNKGDVVTGTYEGLSAEQHVFSVYGFKDDIRIDDKPQETKYISNIDTNDKIDIIITEIGGKNFIIKGSISKLYESRARQDVKDLNQNESVTAYVKELNPAGYDMNILHNGVSLDAFMPNTLAGVNKLVDPKSIIGEEFEVVVESYSDHEGTYIVSRKKYLQSLIPDAIEELEYDEVYNGHVTGTAPFGVFVEFNNCLTGMIHKDNLNTEWQNKIKDIKPGFEVDFYIKEVIKEKGKRHKIVLTQMITDNAWSNIKTGQVVTGEVKSIKDFGVLVALDDDNTVGLIHSSETIKFNKKFKVGEEIDVKILHIDRSSRKIFLIAPN